MLHHTDKTASEWYSYCVRIVMRDKLQLRLNVVKPGL